MLIVAPICSERAGLIAGLGSQQPSMANADYIRRKVSELKEQATRLGSDAVDSLRGSRVGTSVAPTFEELRERARRSGGCQCPATLAIRVANLVAGWWAHSVAV